LVRAGSLKAFKKLTWLSGYLLIKYFGVFLWHCMKSVIFYSACFLLSIAALKAQTIHYTHADTLKGTISKQRVWWDVLHYDLNVAFNSTDSSIKGINKIRYTVLESYPVMQLDLMQPMMIDSISQDSRKCYWVRDGNAFFVSLPIVQKPGEIREITVYFHGKPRVAKMPPWDGGVIWAKDKKNNPWISIACQGMAAGVWFPNKDHMYDEVDSCSLSIICPKDLVAVSNGRMRSMKMNTDGTATYNWVVVNPINNYNIIPYIGKYVYFKDTINGESGTLDLSFWVLEDNFTKAKKHFMQSKTMLHCFENWFGPYPFYEDGYKLIEAPFLGMEHQSGIAYGNDYRNGYQGRDLSQTGWGLNWDFIIIHESGHEWFGNSITAKDVADNWIHEGFTAYSENLYVEYLNNKNAGAEYVIGTRKAVLNDKPVISDYNVNAGGSLDLYYKAANMLHTIRQLVDNDTLWRAMLKGMNKTFWHQTVTTKQIEDYMIGFLKLDLQKTFDQYLRTVKIPVLEYSIRKNKLSYRWTNCVTGFNMPLKITSAGKDLWLHPKESWQTLTISGPAFVADLNFYISVKEVK
jgi:aminopeptidase N